MNVDRSVYIPAVPVDSINSLHPLSFLWKPITANVVTKKKQDPVSHYNEKPSQNKELASQNNYTMSWYVKIMS